MATDVSSMPVNGNYAPHQGFGGIEQQNNFAYNTNTTTSQPPATQPPPSSSTPAASSSSQQPDVSKDEVGWYFVEQYYTTLSRNPENLYLFYNKRSQFVSGQEADKVAVCVGQRAINDRIKELDFKDCKVRVTNVDTQASDAQIVIQVIGAISNKAHPHRKFTQTFVLAAQTNGYFVLNDIFRYLADEEDEVEAEGEPAMQEEMQQIPIAQRGYEEPQGTPATDEPQSLTSSSDPTVIEHNAQQVDKEIEDKVLSQQPTPQEPSHPQVNGVRDTESEVKQAEDAPAAATVAEPALDSTQSLKEEPEKPKAPEPTPAASPPKAATPAPAPAAKPAAPKTWASLAASANRVATPATPSTNSTSTSSANTSQPRATPPTTKTPAQAPPAPSAPAAPAAQRDESPAEGSQGDEWTPVGASHNRQQSRQANVQQEPPQYRGYIKNVHEGIGHDELKAELEKFGELAHFDISRQRNGAFVEFKTADAYNAALNSGPITVGGDRLQVEERRRHPGAGYPRGQYQNRGGRGGMNQGPPRGNYQARGGTYTPRGGRGGGAPAPRARGGSQAV